MSRPGSGGGPGPASVSEAPRPSAARPGIEGHLAHGAGAGHLPMCFEIIAQARVFGADARAGVGQHAGLAARRAAGQIGWATQATVATAAATARPDSPMRKGERRRGAATMGNSASSARARRAWKAALASGPDRNCAGHRRSDDRYPRSAALPGQQACEDIVGFFSVHPGGNRLFQEDSAITTDLAAVCMTATLTSDARHRCLAMGATLRRWLRARGKYASAPCRSGSPCSGRCLRNSYLRFHAGRLRCAIPRHCSIAALTVWAISRLATIDSGVLMSVRFSVSLKVSPSSVSIALGALGRRPWEASQFLAVLMAMRYNQV